MDRDLREMPKRGERWSQKAAGVESLPKGAMQLSLHARGCNYCVLKRVEDGPVFWTHVERDKVTRPVVPWSTAGGDGVESGVPEWGEVVGSGPSSGGLAHAEDLVNLMLLE